MVGLGETRDDVARLLDDLTESRVHVVTIGQYLQPTARHLEVAEYVHPDLFAEYKQMGYDRGFDFVESGPLVRSSYHAERHIG
jgi:lipoic acid synthetase